MIQPYIFSWLYKTQAIVKCVCYIKITDCRSFNGDNEFPSRILLALDQNSLIALCFFTDLVLRYFNCCIGSYSLPIADESDCILMLHHVGLINFFIYPVLIHPCFKSDCNRTYLTVALQTGNRMIRTLIECIDSLCLIGSFLILYHRFSVKKSRYSDAFIVPDVIIILVTNVLRRKRIDQLCCCQPFFGHSQRNSPGYFLTVMGTCFFLNTDLAVSTGLNLSRSSSCMFLVICNRIAYSGILHKTGHICIRCIGDRILIDFSLIILRDLVCP